MTHWDALGHVVVASAAPREMLLPRKGYPERSFSMLPWMRMAMGDGRVSPSQMLATHVKPSLQVAGMR